MFSVPFDHNLYENWFALGLFDTSQVCDESLFDLMYYKEGSFMRAKASGSEMSFQAGQYILRGTMCPVANAEVKVELWDHEVPRLRSTHSWLSTVAKRYFKCVHSASA
ncbi:hypothetical protein COCON_G00070930 [Conger conger]|uniref:Uncharacterized protein n=2 Tax=Conger conger TaxID=82655 RepID=A0A9Q1DTA1_CONCO|nr:hypothetical protein COCON_G00070930 [Conger conger]